MQGKSLVIFFLGFMSLVCAYQFALTIPTGRAEAAAEAAGKKAVAKMAATAEAADKEVAARNATNAYLDSISSQPLFMGQTYSSLKKKQLALGLDLKGGMSVVMQVDLSDLISELANKSKDPAFVKALAEAKKAQANSQDNYVDLFAREFAKAAPGKPLATIFAANPALKEKLNFSSTDAQVLTFIRTSANETVNTTYDRLKKRIDKFGATQPNVTLDSRTDRIIVELPGVTNPERARNFLQASAKLEFWEVYRTDEIGNGFTRANDVSKNINVDAKVELDTTGKPLPIVADSTKVALNTGLFGKFTLNAGDRSPAVMGVALAGDTVRINKILHHPSVRTIFPPNARFMWDAKPEKSKSDKGGKYFSLYAIKGQQGKDNARLEGNHVTSTSASTDETGRYVVNLSMDSEGARTWSQMTREAAPQKREVAISLDNEVVSAPSVQNEINGGNTQISGTFTAEEAQDLASILQVGKLPARTEIIEENVVGPTLGKDNINHSMWAMLGGIFMTILFMVAYYSSAGVVAIIALLANFIFLIACLSSFGLVLTVPGVAGIVLTIGMAVDANIIIYERIREELRDGKSTLQAIRDGFTHSYAPILDSHATALITSLILLYFGSGPTKGFGLVLTFGVFCTLFASLLVSRLVMEWWTAKGNTLQYATKMSERVFENVNIDFVGMRKTTYILSGLFSLIALVSMFVRGFDLGVDFTGGYSYALEFKDAVKVDAVRDALTKSFGVEPVVKTFNTANTIEVTTSYKINETAPETGKLVEEKLMEGLKPFGEAKILRSIKVGPTVADDIRNSSAIVAFLAIGLIFVYILVRFRKWQYSLGATVALVHDVIHTMGWFTIFWGIFPFSMQIDQAFIAAILTIIGYSMNDTVIVFDRIREYLGMYPDEPQDKIINKAINNTLNRTVITSLVTLLTVVILFIFGGPVIRGFAFALTIGMIVGTYSSIFIATPIVVDFGKNELAREIAKAKEAKKEEETVA
jgi:SecD/SecF fusion protein